MTAPTPYPDPRRDVIGEPYPQSLVRGLADCDRWNVILATCLLLSSRYEGGGPDFRFSRLMARNLYVSNLPTGPRRKETDQRMREFAMQFGMSGDEPDDRSGV